MAISATGPPRSGHPWPSRAPVPGLRGLGPSEVCEPLLTATDAEAPASMFGYTRAPPSHFRGPGAVPQSYRARSRFSRQLRRNPPASPTWSQFLSVMARPRLAGALGLSAPPRTDSSRPDTFRARGCGPTRAGRRGPPRHPLNSSSTCVSASHRWNADTCLGRGRLRPPARAPARARARSHPLSLQKFDRYLSTPRCTDAKSDEMKRKPIAGLEVGER